MPQRFEVRRWRPMLLRAALCLFLGAAATLSIAWLIHFRFNVNGGSELGHGDAEVHGGGERWAVSITSFSGLTEVRIVRGPSAQSLRHLGGWAVASDEALSETAAMLPVGDFRRTPLFHLLPFHDVLQPPSSDGAGSTTLWALGLPSHSLAMTRHDAAGTVAHSGAIATP